MHDRHLQRADALCGTNLKDDIDGSFLEAGILHPENMGQKVDLDFMTVDRRLDDGRLRRGIIRVRDA